MLVTLITTFMPHTCCMVTEALRATDNATRYIQTPQDDNVKWSTKRADMN